MLKPKSEGIPEPDFLESLPFLMFHARTIINYFGVCTYTEGDYHYQFPFPSMDFQKSGVACNWNLWHSSKFELALVKTLITKFLQSIFWERTNEGKSHLQQWSAAPSLHSRLIMRLTWNVQKKTPSFFVEHSFLSSETIDDPKP